VALVAYLGVFLYCWPLQLQDYPNHLARAVVMANLMFDHGTRFGATFAYQFLIIPYVLADWILATIVQVVGVSWASRLWSLLIFLSLPAALYAYLRAKRASASTVVILLLLSLYLSTDTFFVLGFVSFRFAVAMVLVALAVVEPLSYRWSGWRYGAWVGVVMLGYLTHLAALVFTAIALGTCSLIRIARRSSSIGREFLLLLPIAGLALCQVALAARYRRAGDEIAETYIWGTPRTKVADLLWVFLGFHSRWQLLILAALVACLLVLAVATFRARQSRPGGVVSHWREPAVLEPWGIALAFACVYVVLPSSYSEASFVDVRALAPLWLFLIIGLVRWWERSAPSASRAGSLARALALLVAALNLGYLGKRLYEDRSWLIQYRSVVASVPEGSSVLPIYTAARSGIVRSRLHGAAYLVIDRAANMPYLFSGDRGDPMEYFRYVNRPYAPPEDWYGSHQSVDWNRVAGSYQFLLIMKPFEADRIPLTGRVVAQNQTALLLALH